MIDLCCVSYGSASASPINSCHGHFVGHYLSLFVDVIKVRLFWTVIISESNRIRCMLLSQIVLHVRTNAIGDSHCRRTEEFVHLEVNHSYRISSGFWLNSGTIPSLLQVLPPPPSSSMWREKGVGGSSSLIPLILLHGCCVASSHWAGRRGFFSSSFLGALEAVVLVQFAGHFSQYHCVCHSAETWSHWACVFMS